MCRGQWGSYGEKPQLALLSLISQNTWQIPGICKQLVLADSAPDVTVLQTSSSPACYGFAFLWAAGSVGAAWEEHLQLLRNATASGLLVDLCTCLCVSVRMWSQNHHLTECAHSLWNFRCIHNVHVVSS